MPLAAEFG